MPNLIWSALFLPLAGFIGLMATAQIIRRPLAGFIACMTLFLSFCCFASLFIGYESPTTVTLFSWIPVKGIDANFTVHIDPLSLLMTLIITGVGFLIHVYSIGYMDHEEDFARYFACLNFFVFAMLLLVLAGHLLLLFVGWEGVGLASYLLIGFWHQKPDAARSATKAFVVNRVGDLGFLMGILLLFYTFGSGDIAAISVRASQEFAVGAPTMTLLALLLFIGATGKSAQLPLHTWLPDAMAGPTPVSALIHAATMVTAGVYLVVRMQAIFLLAPQVLLLIAVVGAVTSLFAALCAVGQTDLKRVLAYSTVSQLGLMFLACGIGGFYAAMFHLTTHAFIKALLFLTAGNVVHMTHGITDMRKMGGLKAFMGSSNWLFLIGVLAMSGIPPLAAFFSKDLIFAEHFPNGYEFLFYIGLTTSILTAFYLTRAYCLTFTGTTRDPEVARSVVEAPPVMLLPIAVLALLALFGGFLGFSFGNSAPLLQQFLHQLGITEAEEHFSSHLLYARETWMAVLGALVGITAAVLLYRRYSERRDTALPLLKRGFFVDELYQAFIIAPLSGVAYLIVRIFEPIVEGSIMLTGRIAKKSGMVAQRIQSGQIRSYVAWMVAGTALMIVYYLF